MAGGAIVRPPEAHELEAFADCLAAAFGVGLPAPQRARLLAALEPGRALACFDGADLVATASSVAIELTLPGPVVSAATGVADVAVLPSHRGRGLFSALLGRLLEVARGSGEALLVLDAASAPRYRRLGFGPASWSARYRLAPGGLVLAAAEPARGGPRPLSATEALETLPAAFDAARRSILGELARTRAWWEEELADLPGPDGAARRWVAWVEGGEVAGFLAYELAASPAGREALVEDLCVRSVAAAGGLWRVLAELDAPGGICLAQRPLDEPLRHALADPRSLEVLAVRDATWLRVVDVAAAVPLRRYGAAGSLTFEVADGRCGWNEGRWVLESDWEGRGHAERTGAPAQLALDVGALASLLAGAASPASLAAAGRVRELAPGALTRAGRLFAAEAVPFASSAP
ncbi:MAG TPA: GNAT family N-acetyltransferase [Acidimicrobiales bacterium]|nr:GNAT family N-acetyltransferase [Acidimicrobiales bacterium]